jgi:hypothetical protein
MNTTFGFVADDPCPPDAEAAVADAPAGVVSDAVTASAASTTTSARNGRREVTGGSLHRPGQQRISVASGTHEVPCETSEVKSV